MPSRPARTTTWKCDLDGMKGLMYRCDRSHRSPFIPRSGWCAMRLVRAFVILIVAAAAVGAQQPSSPWLRETFKSAKLGEDRTIYVATPANYNATAQRYPVLVL